MSADGEKGINVGHSSFDGKTAFECPHCGTFIGPEWRRLGPVGATTNTVELVEAVTCAACDGILIALGNTVVYPSDLVGPVASTDMPELVRTEYDEARRVGAASPRAAAALLRLAIQKLVDRLRPGKEDLDLKIGLVYWLQMVWSARSLLTCWISFESRETTPCTPARWT